MNIYADHYGMRMTPYTDSNTIPRTLPTPRSVDAEGKPNWKHSFGCFGLFDDDDGVTGLYPVSLVIEDAEVKTHYQDIPGSDGVEDWTEALTGTAHYGNRAGTFRFKFIGPRNLWKTVYHHLQSVFHGQRCAIILDEDRAGYYYGRFAVEKPEQAEYATYFTITADLYPYQMDFTTASPNGASPENELWLFDSLYIAEPALPQAGLGIIHHNVWDIIPSLDFVDYIVHASPLPQHPVINVRGLKFDADTQKWVNCNVADGDVQIQYSGGYTRDIGGGDTVLDEIILTQKPYYGSLQDFAISIRLNVSTEERPIEAERATIRIDYKTGRL
jgi:hypothetical protein